MSEKKRILVVDDSPIEIRVLMETLKDNYAVVPATDGEKAIAIVNGDSQPDLILLDVNMEPIDGYETCKRISETHPEIPIIFVSSNQETEEILKGFEVGGVDYIVKPINPEVLSSKVSVTLELQEKQSQLKQQQQMASDMAMTAMSNAGDLGITQAFLREGLKSTNIEELMKALLNSLTQFSLQVCVQGRSDENTTEVSSAGIVSALERELLNRSINMDQRIVEMGSRVVICFDSVSILVKNMPVDNEARCGELRDYLLILAEDAHLLNMKVSSEMSLARKRSNLVSAALSESQETLSLVKDTQKNHQEATVKVMDDMLKQVEEILFTLGMTEEQEQTLTKILQESIHKALDLADKGVEIDDQLQSITHRLGEIANSFNQ